jgi:hypothetical protein
MSGVCGCATCPTVGTRMARTELSSALTERYNSTVSSPRSPPCVADVATSMTRSRCAGSIQNGLPADPRAGGVTFEVDALLEPFAGAGWVCDLARTNLLEGSGLCAKRREVLDIVDEELTLVSTGEHNMIFV